MKKLIVLVVLAFIMLTACKEEEVILQSKTSINHNEMIDIVTNGELSMNDVDSFIERAIATQPIKLVELTNSIVVCNDEEYLKYPISDTSIAFSNPNDMSIYTRVNADMATITHELAHIFDYKDGYHFYSDSQKFTQLYEEYKGTFRFINDVDDIYSDEELNAYDRYFNDNKDEFFAGVVELYINHDSYLKKECYDIYIYLKDILADIIE